MTTHDIHQILVQRAQFMHTLPAIREASPMPLPDLLLAKGSMTGPYRKTRPRCSPLTRLRRWLYRVVDRIAIRA